MAADGEESSSNAQIRVKDPRLIARKYQLDLCKKAVEQNIIVYLKTGCGKTHIAVLLMYELAHLIKKPQKDVCVFLAPTVPLVRQQASVIEESTDFIVGSYYGDSNRTKNHQEWEKEIEKYEVLVMTPQILLHNLFHRLIKMELIALLIFDECHHAQAQSSHPYAEIMKVYKTNATKRPRIFGMTASPIVGKGRANPEILSKCINSLEFLLDAKVYSVEDTGELERYVASPNVKCYYYGPVGDHSFKNFDLEEIKNRVICSIYLNLSFLISVTLNQSLLTAIPIFLKQCIAMAGGTTNGDKILRNRKKLLLRLHDNLMFCLENLGLLGAKHAVRFLMSGDRSELIEMIDIEDDSTDNSLTDLYLSQAASVLDSESIRDGYGFDSSMEALKEPFFSKKIMALIQILFSCRIRQDMKCIVFVNRIIIARALSYILRKLKCLSFWKCDFLVGYHSGVKSMSRKTMNSILEKFRSGELNLLVATRVGEEGLDIQTCCLVIRFDLPETVASFIQSKGRARMSESEYVFLVNRENEGELNLIEDFISEECQMTKEIACRTSGETFDDLEEVTYTVCSTGASITAGYSVSLLYHYCSKLPHDEFFIPTPEFDFEYDTKGTLCRVILPSNAPIHQVDCPPQSSKEKAKKIGCLRACEELHAVGALTDYLLPGQDDEPDERSMELESFEDESSRGELHQMLSPSVLKNTWTDSENPVLLNFYFIECLPVPNDRLYQKFGLFVKAPLPEEAGTMELDLHLAHGRIVKTKLVPQGVKGFERDEIIQAQNIQELFLKIVLDRSEFFANFVKLGKNASSQASHSAFYLLLPVRQNDCEGRLTVDWKLIRRCLSSPVFGTQKDVLDSVNVPDGSSLILADGPASKSVIVNSLVFTPHKKLFFFVDDILPGIDANSPFTDRSCSNYVDHYAQKFNIHILHPKQPLLKAKQLFSLHNLLHNRVQENTEARALDEHFVELPPELCSLKIIGFSKDIGSSLSLLPSVMHRLENLLVAIELKGIFSLSFPEGSEVTADRVLEAITTEKCMERFSLERLEVLGDAFLKYAVGRHVFLLHETIDEGQLTRKRSSIVKNSHLYKLAIQSNLQVYIRDENFDPSQFFALGRPCTVICNENTENSIHFQQRSGNITNGSDSISVRCSKGHHWLQKKTIADIVEALVGAFLVDSGFKAAIAFLKWIGIQVDFEATQVSKMCLASKNYMSISSNIDIPALEKSLGYTFLHKGLLVQAFVHPSYNKHSGGCYQRLEFLGDAVLDYLITSYLFSVYPKLKPGQLTDLRSVTVNNNVFAHVAVCRSFHRYLINDSDDLSEAVKKFVISSLTSAEKDPIEGSTCPKALGDLVESCVGAVLLDTGFNLNIVWKIMLTFLDPIMKFSNLQLNPVRELTELCQSRCWELQFSESKKGAVFIVHARVTTGGSVEPEGHATNVSKKAAMRMAAKQIFLKLKARGYNPKKSGSLEHVLKSSKKQEAKLIGYDEEPTEEVFFDLIQRKNLVIGDSSSTSAANTLDPQTVNEEEPNYISGSSTDGRKPTVALEAPVQHLPAIREISISVDEVPTHIRASSSNNRQPTVALEAPVQHLPVIREISISVNEVPTHIPASNSIDRQPIIVLEAPVRHLPVIREDSISATVSHNGGVSHKLSAKSRLFEICAVNHWKAPVFECVKEEGPSHLKLFTYKVTVEVGEVTRIFIECFSEPRAKKKAAEEHAAEGALWCLQHQGLMRDHQRGILTPV